MHDPKASGRLGRWFNVYLSSAVLAIPGLAIAQDDGDDQVIDEIVVEGIAYGAARALAQQKNSETIVTIVSEETLENLPDQSVGEALGRLPGVSIQRDRGEANFITIRGAAPRLNNVTLNGDQILTPEDTLNAATRGNRAPKLNSVPSTLISQIEVFKAVPPKMDGDSIGGAVEIKTKGASGLNEAIVDATLRYGYNQLNDGNLTGGEFTWGAPLNDSGTIGVIATLSYEEDDRGVSGLEMEWAGIDELLDLATGDTVALPEERHVIETFDVTHREFTRTRKGANLTFDWQPSDNHLFKAGGWYSTFQDDELRRRLQWRVGASADFTTATTFDDQGRHITGETDGGRSRRRVRLGTVDRTNYNAFLEGNHLFDSGLWTFDWRVSHSFADQVVQRTRGRWEARAQDIGLRGDGVADWSFTNGNGTFVNYTTPAWENDPSVLQIGNRGDGLQNRNETSDDTMDSVKLDFGRMFNIGDGQVNVEFGYKGRFRNRELWPRTFDFEGDPDNPIFMEDFLGAGERTPWQPFGYDNGLWGDATLLDAHFNANPQGFLGNNLDERYSVDEDINAFYLMGTWNRGPWTVIGGVRYEDTETNVTARDGSAVNSYDNVLPAIIARYALTDNQIIRAAWTNSLGRPDFPDIRPFFSDEFVYEINDDTGLPEGSLRIDGGNPDLQPFEAFGLDFSYEYYTDSGGVFSAGIFYKEIDNFEYTEELMETDVTVSNLPAFLRGVAQDAIDQARADDPSIPADLNTLSRFNYARPVNGDTATVLGYELNFQQQFTELPWPWNGVGIFANYTYIDGDSDVTDGISRDFVIGQFEDTLNLQLFYEVEQFTARIAYNRNGLTYNSLGLGLSGGVVTDNRDNDGGVDAEGTYDLALQYRLDMGNTGLFKIFFDVVNLTDERTRNRFLGSQSLYRQVETEFNGRSFHLGFRWSR